MIAPKLDFNAQFRVMGTVAKYFGGAASIEFLEKQTFDFVWFWYKIYEFQATHEEIVSELRYDSKGNPRKLPSEARLTALTEARIKEKTGR